MSDLRYHVWLSLKMPPGHRGLCQLINQLGSPEAIFNISPEDLDTREEIDKRLAEKLSDKTLDDALRIIDFCKKNRISLLPFDAPTYPKRLRRLPDFPLLLYIKGHLPDIDNMVCIATVGTRQVTEYGGINAYTIARDLARAGVVIVSGLANGIDSCCHRGALDALGPTVAVLGSGIDVIYPKNNAGLFDEIIKTGAVITEYPPGTEPYGYNFPKRNRIISGLCLGTLVLEADRGSGALITARTALAQGRDLFALPGNVGEMSSSGTNELIKAGAHMITGALDILEEYELIFPEVLHPECLLTPPREVNLPHSIHFLQVAAGRKLLTNGRTEKKEEAPKNRSQNESSSTRDSKHTTVSSPSKSRVRSGKSQTSEEETEEIKKTPVLTDIEQQVLNIMPQKNSITVDEIARTGIPVARALVALTTLEIKGLVVPFPGGAYMKKI